MLVGFKLYQTQSLAASGAVAGINVGPERAQLETEFKRCVRRSGDRVRIESEMQIAACFAWPRGAMLLGVPTISTMHLEPS
jgi:hypothetical protein